MTKQLKKEGTLTLRPLISDIWDDFENLFGPKGACAGCWCMWFRIKRTEWEMQKVFCITKEVSLRNYLFIFSMAEHAETGSVVQVCSRLVTHNS